MSLCDGCTYQDKVSLQYGTYGDNYCRLKECYPTESNRRYCICRKEIKETTKESLKNDAIKLWTNLQQSELPYEDFMEVQCYILDLFNDIN